MYVRDDSLDLKKYMFVINMCVSGNITDHFAISGNRADCQSKESTQETLVSLVGMCCGVSFVNVLHRLEKIITTLALVSMVKWTRTVAGLLIHVPTTPLKRWLLQMFNSFHGLYSLS